MVSRPPPSHSSIYIVVSRRECLLAGKLFILAVDILSCAIVSDRSIVSFAAARAEVTRLRRRLIARLKGILKPRVGHRVRVPVKLRVGRRVALRVDL